MHRDIITQLMIQDTSCALVLSKDPFFFGTLSVCFHKIAEEYLLCFILDPFSIVCCLIFHNASELPEERRCGAPRLFVPAEIGRVVALIQCDTMIQIMGKTLFCLKSLRLKSLRDTAAAAAQRVCIGRCGQYRGRGQMSDRHHVPVIRLGNMDNITDRPNKWQNQF